jgi:L-seryl-tRNA(Ser) seleniumtransferase
MANKKRTKDLKGLPSVNEALKHPKTSNLIERYGRTAVKHAVRDTIDRTRNQIMNGDSAPGIESIVDAVSDFVQSLHGGTLKPVINATGIILHTNLSRAPLGHDVISEIAKIAGGYSNLEYDLAKAKRGNRNSHVRRALSFLTSAEDAVVVNNNAAGIVLALSTFARDREVLISRGELIEIGGSFRIPEIMEAAGAKMVEVGTTNRTRLSDYEKAFSPQTTLIFKAHRSNFSMQGFVEEVSIRDLADFAHEHSLPMMYDLGSGLLRKPKGLPLESEPDVMSTIADGADIVAFSGDKLLGGPQSGILVGRKEFIEKMARSPLMRALRVCKLTYAALTAVCRQYFTDEALISQNPTFAMLQRGTKETDRLATMLVDDLERLGIAAKKVNSFGRCGGGTLPDLKIPSIAIEIPPVEGAGTKKKTFAEGLFKRLLQIDRPILSVLREGRIILDMLTVFEKDIPYIAGAISNSIEAGS